MLKPFYNKKKNIDDRLVPAVSAADAGKVLGVTEEGKIAPVEGGGGGSYTHLLTLDQETRAIIVNDDPTPFTKTTLLEYLNANGLTTRDKYYPAISKINHVSTGGTTLFQFYYGIYWNSATTLRYVFVRLDPSTVTSTVIDNNQVFTVTDTVLTN